MTREEMVRSIHKFRQGDRSAGDQLAARFVELAAEFLPAKWSPLGIEFKERVCEEAAERALASLRTCDTTRDPRRWYARIVERTAAAVFADVRAERAVAHLALLPEAEVPAVDLSVEDVELRDEVCRVVEGASKLLKKRPARLLSLMVLDGLDADIAGHLVGLKGSSLYEAIATCHAAAARVMRELPELDHIDPAKLCRKSKA